MTISRGQRYAATFAILTAAALTPLVGSTAANAAAASFVGPDCSAQSAQVSQAISDRNDAHDALVAQKTDVYDPAVTARNEAIAARRQAADDRIEANAAVAAARDAYAPNPTEENAQLLQDARDARTLAAQKLVDARGAVTDKTAAFTTAAAERSTLSGTYTKAKSDLATPVPRSRPARPAPTRPCPTSRAAVGT